MIKKKLLLIGLCLLGCASMSAQQAEIIPLAENAVRIKYGKPQVSKLPEWVYVNDSKSFIPEFLTPAYAKGYSYKSSKGIKAFVDKKGYVTIRNSKGKVIFKSVDMSLKPSSVQGESTNIAELSFKSPLKGTEYQYGLGQFQDGVSNVYGLTRRLTQVNTQISIPMMMSSKGYAILWNNYGMTEFNPCANHVQLEAVKQSEDSKGEVVDVTTTTGNRREVRRQHSYSATINVEKAGDYTILLDVGQKMARKHWMSIDDEVVIDMSNVWLPPTTSTKVYLTKGRHTIVVQGNQGDKPSVYWDKIDDITTFRSPVAECVDFTIFTGTADEIIATYRRLTGAASPMPEWALGYIHCRERFHSQDEIITTARRFQKENIPLDVIVQDWQWWGKYGWNAMQFDEDHDAECVVED